MLLLSPWLQTLGAAEGRESIIPISTENSRSVITLSQAIKLLPRGDRWQMLEGLFIFCLLIRAAKGEVGAQTGERGVRERYKRRGGGLTDKSEKRKVRTPCSRRGNNFDL